MGPGRRRRLVVEEVEAVEVVRQSRLELSSGDCEGNLLIIVLLAGQTTAMLDIN